MQHLKIDSKRSAGVVTILDKQKVFPMSHIRALMEQGPQSIEIWHWDIASKKFTRVQPIVEKLKGDRRWTVLQALPGLAQMPAAFAGMMHWDKNDLVIDGKKEPVVISTNLGHCPTWGISFLCMDVTRDKGCPPGAIPSIAVPSDRGNIFIAGMPIKVPGDPAPSVDTTGSRSETLLFPLRSIPAWTLDYARVPAIPLIFSGGWQGQLHSLRSLDPTRVMPQTSLKCFGGGNFYRLWKKRT